MTSPKITVTLRELEETWSIDDIEDALEVLNVLEDAERGIRRGGR